MKTVESQGYSKEKAFKATGLDADLEMMTNATQAWKKAGSPMGTKALNTFMENYLKAKKKTSAYLVIDPASEDTRTRPYTIINEVTTGKRKTTTVYQIKEAEFTVKYVKDVKTVVDKETNEEKQVEFMNPYHKETITSIDKETGETITKEVEIPSVKVINTGVVVHTTTKKDAALKAAKELTALNGKDYVVEIVKEVTEGQKYAAYSQYTPSKSAKEGKFMFFVKEA